jgi:calcineurin-like phosphoesterase family protein
LGFGKIITFSHKPVADGDGDFDINIHGHHHNTEHHPEDAITPKHRLVFVDHEYKPINLKKIVEGRD